MARAPDFLQPARVRFDEGERRIERLAQPIGIVSIAATATTVYANAGASDFLIRSLWFSNITASPATLALHAVPTAGSPADANAIMKGFSLDAYSGPVAVCSENGILIRLQPGMSLVALSGTASAINAGGWGFEIFGGEA